MIDETYRYKLKIAQLVYRDIITVLDKYTNDPNVKVYLNWDGSIRVDDELFRAHLLKDNE